MNWNISVACSRLSVSEDQPNSKWTTNDGCGCRGSDLQTECLLTLSVSLFVFLIFFFACPPPFFRTPVFFSFSLNVTLVPYWFVALCWWIPCDCSELNKNWNASKVITVNGTNEHLPCSRVLLFFLFWDLRFLLIKRSLLTTSLFMFFSAVLRCVILFFITFKGDCRGGNERF